MKNYIFIIFLIYAVNVFSQHTTDSAKVIVYDPFNANQTVDMKNNVKHDKNIIKWNIGMLGRGAFEMDYERCLSDKFTFEFGAGITYIDFIEDVYSDISGNSNNFTSDNSNYKYGVLLTGDLKFYPKSVLGFEGLYVSIPLRFRNYISTENITYTPQNTNGSSQSFTGTFQNNQSHVEYGFIVGNQTGRYWGDIVWDYYFGVGFNAMTTNEPVSDANDIPQQVSDHHTRPIIFLGIKMGLPF
jgi:hypothetical protein